MADSDTADNGDWAWAPWEIKCGRICADQGYALNARSTERRGFAITIGNER